MNDVVLDLQVPIDELCRLRAVGQDAADLRGCEEHELGSFRFEELPNADGILQVKLTVRTEEQIFEAFLAKGANDRGTNQSTMTCDKNPGVLLHLESSFPCLFKICADHQPREVFKFRLGSPVQLLLPFRAIAEEEIHFCRATIPRINLNEGFARSRINPLFISSFPSHCRSIPIS